MSHMESIGVRELRRELSAVLRKVERGESFAVTSRGREVARLGPAAAPVDPIERLVHARGAIAARRDVLEVPPLAPGSGARPLSDLLDEDRAERL